MNEPLWRVDPERARAGSAPRTEMAVAVGVLLASGGEFLLTSRPPGKVYAGYWEFPGGKIERGESVEQALRRELQEEIGVTPGAVQPCKSILVDYPHALVRLHICKVFRWSGALQMLEGQQFCWERLPPRCTPLLPGSLPVLQWLETERSQRDPGSAS